MIAPARKAARRVARPATESAVYLDRELAGEIKPKAGVFIARLANGRSLGRYPDERQAMKAITAAARSERATS